MDLNAITDVARPRSRADCGDWRPGDAWLAGGTWLFSEPQPGLTRLRDLAGLDWPALEPVGGGLRIGATCTLAQLAAHETGTSAGPLFAQCCRALLGSFKIWNAATVGGNLCLALPAAPIAALVTSLEGVCTIWTPDGGERRLPAVDFVVGAGRNALSPGELLRAIDLPAEPLRRRVAFRQTSLTPLGRSAALLIATASPSRFSLTVTAATRRPIRLDFAAIPTADALAHALSAIAPETYFDDVHGRPAWRRHMTLRLAAEVRRDLAEPAR